MGLFYVNISIFESVLLPIIETLHQCISNEEFIAQLQNLPKFAKVDERKLQLYTQRVTKFVFVNSNSLPIEQVEGDIQAFIHDFSSEISKTLMREFVKEINQRITAKYKRALRAIVSRTPSTKIQEKL